MMVIILKIIYVTLMEFQIVKNQPRNLNVINVT